MPKEQDEYPKDQIEIGSTIGGWTVKEKRPAQDGGTGSFFSRGYIVVNDNGETAFLKAMDYKTSQRLYSHLKPFERVQQIANDIAFEKKVAKHCKRMSRIVSALEEGSLNEESLDTQIEYIIFEKAEGNIRKFIDFSKDLDVIFILKSLHNACVGLTQLHSQGMVHEDVKPSNVMVMGNKSKHSAKIGDLGRIVVRNPGDFGIVKEPAHFSSMFPGDHSYDPPEAKYNGELHMDRFSHRLSCDLFQFGSLLYFCFVNVSMTAALMNYTHVDHQPGRKSYFEALPYLHAALGEALRDLEDCSPAYLKTELVQIVKELCNPDYRLRGHPKDIEGKHIEPSLHRYHPILNRMLRASMLHIKQE